MIMASMALVVNAWATSLNGMLTGVNSQSWDYIKYFTTINAWIPKNMVFVNKKIFERLDKDTQAVILSAAANAEKMGWELGRKLAVEHTEVLRENGMQVSAPSAELDTELRQIGDVMVKDWLDEAGATGQKVIDAYRAM